jgi:CelD/BcsL family acetyltransferase involved in cellulose biosynthesis
VADAARLKAVECVAVDPILDQRWTALLDSPRAGLFHSPPWFRALADTYGLAIQARIATDSSGRPVGGFAFVELDDALGARITSLPFTDACDPLAESRDCWSSLLDPFLAGNRPVQLRCLDQPFAEVDPRLTVSKRARWHSLSLDPGRDVEAGFHDATGRAIRKAERMGVVTRRLGAAEIPEFHSLHVRLRKEKYRLLAQPIGFFEALARRFGEVDGWFPLGAYAGERLIAAAVYLRWGDVLYYKFNSSAPDTLGFRPNDLLVKAGIDLARSLGCRALDLGPSDDNQPGLIRFKRHFGATERELRFLRYVPAGWHDARGDAMRSLLGDVTRVLTAPEVPDSLTRDAGRQLYRWFA